MSAYAVDATIERKLKEAAHKYSYYDLMDRSVDFILAFIMQDVKKMKEIEEEEPKFGELAAAIIGRYMDSTLPDGTWRDYLGDLFMEYSSNMGKKYKGQFFTPLPLCKMMAQLTVPGELPPREEDYLIGDPACGTGRTIVEVIKMHPNNRFRAILVGQDIDLLCCKMAVVNLWMNGGKGYIIHGNTISMDIWRGWRVYLPDTGFPVREMTPEAAKSIVVGMPKSEAPPVPEVKEKELNGSRELQVGNKIDEALTQGSQLTFF